MSQPKCLDVFDREIHVGDWVCYTTNAEGSSFSFGHVDKINEKHGTRYNGDPYVDYKIVVNKTDQWKNPECHTEWDSVTRTHLPTDRQKKSGQIVHSPWKFMIMP